MSAEQRARMTETFVAVRDAVRDGLHPLFALVVEPAARYQEMPDFPRPSYLPEPPPTTKVGARAAMDALIAKSRRH